MIKLSRTIPFEDSLLFWLGIKPRSREKGHAKRPIYVWVGKSLSGIVVL